MTDRSRFLHFLSSAIFMCGALLGALKLSAASDLRSATAVAKWEISNGSHNIVIDIGDLVTAAQREIVNSGFSTFTLFAIGNKQILEGDVLPDMRLVCSVKYDTWEERYQIIRMDPGPIHNFIAKDYRGWSDECLKYRITDSSLINELNTGGVLTALLQIRQSSPDEGAKIKNWLVRQQSGFMQGLYAHMLGDFQFRGTVKITVSVPKADGDKKGL